MATQTQTTLSDEVKTQYLRRLLLRAVPRLLHSRWAERARVTGYGSAEWRKFASLSAVTTALTEGVTPDNTSVTISTVTATPSFYGAYIQHTDELELTAYDPLLSNFSAILGEQAGLSVDTLVRNALLGSLTKQYAGGGTARNDINKTDDSIDYASFVKALSTLMAADALPVEGGQYIALIHPHSYATLMQDTQFTNTFQQASPRSDSTNPMRTGFMGSFVGVDIYVSSNVKEYEDAGNGAGSSGTKDVYVALMFGKEAYGVLGIGNLDPSEVDTGGMDAESLTGNQNIKPVDIIVKPLGSEGAGDPLNQRATTAWKTALDTQVLNSAWGIELEHANDFTDD